MSKSTPSLYELFRHQRDIHQTPMYANVMRAIGWTIEGKPGAQIFVRKLGPIAVAKMQRPSTVDLSVIRNLRKKYRTITFQIEPALYSHVYGKTHSFPFTTNNAEPSTWSTAWARYGFSHTVMPLAHSASSLIDLRQSETHLLESFSQKTRYNIRYAEKRQHITIHRVPLHSLDDRWRSEFLSLRSEWSKRKNVMGYDEKFMNSVLDSFSQHGACLFAVDGSGKTVATLLVLTMAKTMIYFSAFSSVYGYTLHAPTLLAWNAMMLAKRSGLSIFDFGGVYDPRYTGTYKRWKGFTEFKERFKPLYFLYPKSYMKTGW